MDVIQQCERPLNSKEAAEFLSIHPKTLERFAREGRVPARRIGKLLRFYTSELDAWLRGTVSSDSQSDRVNSQEIQ